MTSAIAQINWIFWSGLSMWCIVLQGLEKVHSVLFEPLVIGTTFSGRTHWFLWSCLYAVCPAKSDGSMSHWFIWLRVLNTTQAHFDQYKAPEHLAAFLYVSLGMGSSHNQPTMCNGLGPVLSSSFNNGSFRFLCSFTLQMDHILMYICLQCSTMLWSLAQMQWSVILFTYVMVMSCATKKNTCVHGIMQRAVDISKI